MTPPEPHRIEFDVPWPPWVAAAYVVPTAEPVLVDAGSPGDDGWAALTEGLAKVGLEPADVEHLLVTHPHTDHDGQVARLVEEADPTVYSLAAVRDRLTVPADDLAGRVRANAESAGLKPEAVEEQVERAVESLERNARFMPPDEIDVLLADGETFEAGGLEFEAVHTPGHQRDHACFAQGDALFAGDQVIETFRAAALNVGLDDGVFASIAEFYDAYDRLSDRAFETVYPGHGPVFSDYAGAVERSIASLDSLVENVRETVERIGPATAIEVDETRVDESRDYTIFETCGALGYLEEKGAVECETEDGVRRYSASSSRSSNF